MKRKAALRLIELVDPAIATLAREMSNSNAKPNERIRAAENVLDRAGYPRRVETDSDTAKQVLLQRLMELRDEANDQLDEQDQLTITSEIVEDGNGPQD